MAGFAQSLNNDHGISPDGSLIVISNHRDRGSEMFLLPASGGEPRLISPDAPSWWHGWSPDGALLAYPAVRGGLFGIYTGAQCVLTYDLNGDNWQWVCTCLKVHVTPDVRVTPLSHRIILVGQCGELPAQYLWQFERRFGAFELGLLVVASGQRPDVVHDVHHDHHDLRLAIYRFLRHQ